MASTMCKFDKVIITFFTIHNVKFSHLDFASGNSIDWVYAAQNVSLTYTIEFRDQGKIKKNLHFLPFIDQ